MRPPMRRHAGGALLVAALATGLALAVATPASAHDPIVDSTPARGEVLSELPTEFQVVSGDRMLYVGNDEVFGLWVRDAAGLFYGDGCVTVVDGTMSTDAVIGDPGAYTLVAEFVSIDGHPTSAEIPFEWEPAGDVEPSSGAEVAPRCEPVPTETPSPSADPSASAAPGETAAPGEESAPGVPSDLWWILGAGGAVVIAVAAAVGVIVRSGRRGGSAG